MSGFPTGVANIGGGGGGLRASVKKLGEHEGNLKYCQKIPVKEFI